MSVGDDSIEHMFDTMELAAELPPAWGELPDDELEALIAELTAEAEAELAGEDVAFEGAAAMPIGLDDVPPGPDLVAMLDSVEVGRLAGFDRVVVLRAHARMAAHFQARVYADMASIAASMRELYGDSADACESAAAEISVALNLTRRAADDELAMALDLFERVPAVWESLAAGDIDRRRARSLVHGTHHLPVVSARAVAATMLEDAADLTTGQIASRLRRLCIEIDPEDGLRRYEDAIERRRVTIQPNPSGTGDLYARDLPADRLAAIRQRIHNLALALKTGKEARTMDQLRTDVLLDLLEGNGLHCGHTTGVVDVHVDLATLVGLRDTPGEIPGYGPIIADIARQIVATGHDAEWRWTLADQAGNVIANGITSRRPTAAMRRHIQARQRICVFPGCRMPATRSDVDHEIPWAESFRTQPRHLAPLCRHHHTIRHLPGWSYRIDRNDTITWRTPLHHMYVRRGPPERRPRPGDGEAVA